MSTVQHIDYATIKERYDLANMIEQEIGQQVSYGKKIHCPFHQDDTPSMVVYQDGRFHCFGCGKRGDLFDFLTLLWDCDLRTVIDRLNDPAIAATIKHIPQQAKLGTLIRPTLPGELVSRLEGHFGEREREYWRKQGIPPSVLYTLRVGWTGKRYAWPWFYRGILTAVKLRRDDDVTPNLEPKYISVKGSRFTAPYNIDAVLSGAPETVLIAEDEKTVMAAMRHHLVAISFPANAWKKDWCNLLSDVKRIIIVADNDERGRESAAKINSMIRRARVVVPEYGKDFFDEHIYYRERIGDRDVETQAVRSWLGI